MPVGLTCWYGPRGSVVNLYGIQGSCERRYTVSGVLQPINADGTSIFKAGRTIPVKFTATGPVGASVTDLAASLAVTMLDDSVEGTYVEADSNVAASTGFRCDTPPTSTSSTGPPPAWPPAATASRSPSRTGRRLGVDLSLA